MFKKLKSAVSRCINRVVQTVNSIITKVAKAVKLAANYVKDMVQTVYNAAKNVTLLCLYMVTNPIALFDVNAWVQVFKESFKVVLPFLDRAIDRAVDRLYQSKTFLKLAIATNKFSRSKAGAWINFGLQLVVLVILTVFTFGSMTALYASLGASIAVKMAYFTYALIGAAVLMTLNLAVTPALISSTYQPVYRRMAGSVYELWAKGELSLDELRELGFDDVVNYSSKEDYINSKTESLVNSHIDNLKSPTEVFANGLNFVFGIVDGLKKYLIPVGLGVAGYLYLTRRRHD